jgi:two-component system, chemotaxis family, response regulator Rcp1
MREREMTRRRGERVVEGASPGNHVLEVLLVDDNPADVTLTVEALHDSGVGHRLTVVHDGVEAMAVLRGDAPRPDIVLLDLNLPRKDGREVLAEIRADPELRHLPVAVLTSSQAEEDVLRSYDLQANGYLIKPVDPVQMLGMLRGMDSPSAHGT